MSRKAIIIAEAGVNHNGSVETAKELIAKAAEAGADYVKFQTFITSKLVCKSAQKAGYQNANMIDPYNDQSSMLQKLELSFSVHKELYEYSANCGIQFLSTGFDEESIDFLDQLGLNFFKVPSGEITNKPYLRHLAGKKKPVIISTGMADMDEVKAALEILIQNGLNLDQITVLQCTTEYPAPFSEVNLRAMVTMREVFGVRTGYSDHSDGIDVALAAIALGAEVIEKHFTLDKRMKGPDHLASIEPHELKKMIIGIRNIELALGNGIKVPSPGEIKNKVAVRKSIVSARYIKKSEMFSSENLTVKRPGNGISPMLWDQIIGSIASRNYEADELIQL